MAIISIDFESYYSDAYSLSKLSEVEYALDARFECIMCAIKIDQGPSICPVGHAAVAAALATIDWSKAAMLSHNVRFDGAILYWVFGHLPALFLDTLGMARALTHARVGKSSLKAVSAYLRLPAKGEEVHAAKGWTLQHFLTAPLHILQAYIAYCIRDNDNCRMIFDRFMRVFPVSELVVIDAAIRMFICPQVQLNPTVLAEHLLQVQAEKAQCMAQVSTIDKAIFSSSTKFATLLEAQGVDVPTKMSPTTGKEIPALAKGDREFKELCADASLSTYVQALLAARVSAKSTIEETRTEKFLKLSLREWPASRGAGWFAVPLRYYGAHTGRFSGDGGINAQNLKRGSRIKEAIQAPPGYVILHKDSSQIEARMVAVLANCLVLLQAFEQGRDVYSEFASSFYKMLVTKKDKLRRFVGKTSILGLGYGMGFLRFRHTLFIGNGGMSVSIDEEEAKRLVWHYRRIYKEIPELWNDAGAMLMWMMSQHRPLSVGETFQVFAGKPVPIVRPGPEGIWLPNGLCIQYPNIRIHRPDPNDGPEIVYDDPYQQPRRLFGGKTVENISQALSRIVITDIIGRVKKDTKVLPFMSTHDSLDYCVRREDAPWWERRLDTEFAIRPSWAPNLPLASEGGWGRNLMIAESEHHPEHNA